MKKRFTFLIAAIAAILMMVQPGKAMGQSTTYTTGNDITWTHNNGVVIGSTTYDACKIASGSSTSITIPSGTTTLYVHCAAWNKESADLSISASSGVSISPATWNLTADAGVSGSSSSFTLSTPANAPTSYFKAFTVSGATSAATITFSCASSKRAVIWGINATSGSSSDPSISAENVNINAGATSGSITYQINNGTNGAVVTAAVQAGATIANLAIDSEHITTTSVPFTCDANTANTAKTATVRLTYGNVTKDVTITQARYVPQVPGYTIDFEYEPESYVDWTFTNMESKKTNSNVSAHGGSYFGDTGGKGTASVTTNATVANPGTLTCYVTKQSDNTTSSTWYIQVKTTAANATWTTVTSRSATDMNKGDWKEFTADLSSYSNVYVRVYYDGSTAVRNIDDLSLTMASTDPSITAADVNIAYDAENGSIGYTIKNTPNPAGTLTAAIAQSPASTIEGLTIGTINASTVAFTCAANNTTTARTATVTLSYTYGDNQTTTKDVVITQAAHPTPSINANAVNIEGTATNGSIAYTIDDGITGGTLSASTTATWLTPGEATDSAVPFTCEANQGVARSATVVLTYTYNNDQTVTKNVTVTQAKAPYTNIPAMFAGATSSNQTVDVIFNNWVVSGVSSNGKNVFVTDNQGNGFVINFSSDQSSTYAVGKILSGTAYSCTLKLNNGYAQLTNVSGLTINTGGTVSLSNIAMADLSGVHTGALVSYSNLTSSVNNNKYYLSDGNTTIQIYTSIYDFNSITANKKYDITGIYQQYSSTKEVLPRSAADIVLKAQMTAPSFNAFTYVAGNTPTAQTAAIAGTDFSGNLTVTVAEGEYVVSNDGSTYGTSATFTKANDNSISNQTLYVKLNSDLSEGTYNGKLSFAANYLDAFDVELEGSVTANPTYNVTLTQPAGDIATIAADPSYAQAGATITLSYSDVDDCYVFSSWSVMWEDTEMHEITPDANNQFEMPAAEVLVSAIFTQKTFTVNYSVNGTVREVLVDNVSCGEEAYMWDEDEMSDEGVTIPSGFEFAGWSTSAGSTETVASFEPTDNSTLYAVLVLTGVSSDYVKVTEDLDDWSGEYLIVYENGLVAFDGSRDNSTNNKIDASSNTIDITDYIDNGVIASNNTTDAASFTISAITGGYSIKSSSGYYIGSDSYNNELDVDANTAYTNTLSIDESGNAVVKGYINNTTYTALKYNVTSGQERFRYYKDSSSQQDIQLYKKQTGTSYTRIFTDETNATANITIEGPTLITSGAVLNMGNHTLTCNNPANLIIEDGGQLKFTNTGAKDGGVQATVQKNITKWDEGSTGGWYFIASPISGSISPASVTNLLGEQIQTTPSVLYNYDLYRFNPSEPDNKGWENYHQHNENADPFMLINGQGYLYAKSSTTTLEFAGAIKPYDANNTIPVVVGWNLIGNPYTFNAYPNHAYYTINDANTGITANTETSNAAVAPCTGIIVKATSDGTVKFLEDGPAASANHGNLQMVLSQTVATRGENSNVTLDNAIVSFNEGTELEKFYFGTQDANIYIPQNNEQYAIVSSEARGEMPVCFKANRDGQFTINVNAENVEMSYLHLIDNIAGQDIDLLNTPSYTFEAKGDDYESRFRLVFSASQNENQNENENFAFISNGEIIVNGTGTIQIIDFMGRVISTKSTEERISTNGMTPGVYVLRLIGNDTKTQKIVVK